MNVYGESFVLTRMEPGKFSFAGITKGSVVVRSTYLATKPAIVVYREGQDYEVDYVRGTLARTISSRIPDFSTNPLFEQKDFDHTKFPGFTNHPWFVWVDYKTSEKTPWARRNDQKQALSAVKKKLQAGGAFKIVSYGDSITAGGEASDEALRFQWLWVASLKRKFPRAAITIEDLSLSGYSSRQGIDWFDKKPESLRPVTTLGTCETPDLVLVGFGMNDHNRGSAEPEVFKSNLVALTKLIRERKGASVLLFSAFPPNDDWHYGTHRMTQFAAATKQAASEANAAYVDVFSTWEQVLRRKDQPSLLGNNINHPNDFGHWLYAQAFEALVF